MVIAAARSAYEQPSSSYEAQAQAHYKQQKAQAQAQPDYEAQTQRRQYQAEHKDYKHIPIVKFEAEQSKSGYKFGYEAANGIQVIEQGQVKNEGTKEEANVAEGYYSYKGDDGKEYSVHYVADENGFRAVGDHLPTPPALPEENQRLIAETYARPTSKYDEEDYEHEEGQQKQVRYQQPQQAAAPQHYKAPTQQVRYQQQYEH